MYLFGNLSIFIQGDSLEDEEKEMQNDLLNYRFLESRIKEMMKQRDFIMSKMAEIESTIDSLKDVDASKKILFSLGAEAYTIGKIVKKNNVLIDIGSGILLEKSIDEGKSTLAKRKEDLDKALIQIDKEIVNSSSIMDKLSMKMQNTPQKS